MAAGSHKLDNMIAIVDVNIQADGLSRDSQRRGPCAKFEAFDWPAFRVNGNDIDGLVAAFDAARRRGFAVPAL